jgi:hypothetical protein
MKPIERLKRAVGRGGRNPEPDPGFRPASGMSYLDFLRRLHESVTVDCYLEIGCRSGESFAPSRSRTVGVDPFFSLRPQVMGAKPALHLFQMTSDAFFESGFLERNGLRLAFSFLDGMHLVEFLLRDFINTERHSDPGGAIAMHDCCPFTHAMAAREAPTRKGLPWTGDVWKLIPILARWRPDLKVEVLGCRPTGLVVVTGLDPESRVLAEAQEAILAEFGSLDLGAYGVERFFAGFEYLDPEGVAAGGFAFLDPVRLDPSATPAPAWVSP